MHQQVGISLGIAALGTGGSRGISAQLDLAFQKRIPALRVHYEENAISRLPTQLRADVATFQRIHGGRSPRAGKVLTAAAGHSAPSVAAANTNGKLLYRRKDNHTLRAV